MYVTFFSRVRCMHHRFPFPVPRFPSIVFRYPLVDPSVLFLFKEWGEEEEEEKSIYGSPHFFSPFLLYSFYLLII